MTKIILFEQILNLGTINRRFYYLPDVDKFQLTIEDMANNEHIVDIDDIKFLKEANVHWAYLRLKDVNIKKYISVALYKNNLISKELFILLL